MLQVLQGVSPNTSRLRMELQDPLTDVTTPEVTDSEPEGDDEVKNGIFEKLWSVFFSIK